VVDAVHRARPVSDSLRYACLLRREMVEPFLCLQWLIPPARCRPSREIPPAGACGGSIPPPAGGYYYLCPSLRGRAHRGHVCHSSRGAFSRHFFDALFLVPYATNDGAHGTHPTTARGTAWACCRRLFAPCGPVHGLPEPLLHAKAYFLMF